MTMRTIVLAGMAMSLLLSAACSQAVMKAYPGPELPADQTALVETGAYTQIVALDGQGVKAQNLSVLPGPHTIQMRIIEYQEPMYNQYWFYGYGDGSARFIAQPGHRYQVSISFVPSPFPLTEQADSGFRWVGYVTDRTNHQIVASTAYLPVGAWPRVPYTLRAGR